MSWLTDLANKTESFLNTIDNNAAVVLQKPRSDSSQLQADSGDQSGSFGSPSVSTGRAGGGSSALKLTSMSKSSRSARADQDDQLIAYLNNDRTPALSSRGSDGHSRQSSVSSMTSVGNFLAMATGSEPAVTPDTEILMPDSSAPGGHSENHSEQDQVRMLQQEIVNLNREMSQLLDRAKKSEKECTRVRQQLTSNSSQLTDIERQCRHLQQRELDLLESLKSKDGQLAVLKIRLDESDGELKSRQSTIERLQLENERVLQSSTDTAGAHTGAIQQLRDRLQEAEDNLRQEQMALASIRQDHDRRVDQLMAECETLAAELTAARQRVSSQQADRAQLQRQLTVSQQSAESAAAELSEYKAKAQHILSCKDQLIASLRRGDSDDVTDSCSQLVDAELAQVCAERDLLQSESQRLSEQLQRAQDELRTSEAAVEDQLAAAAAARQQLEEQLVDANRQRLETEAELQQAQQEIRYVREDVSRHKTQAMARMHERDDEIEKLRRQITARHVASSTEVELENRLRCLTENLIQKQTNIESLSTANRALRVQLERCQSQLSAVDGSVPSVVTHRGGAVFEESGRPRLGGPVYAETPWDGGVTRRVKRVYSSLDTLSIKLGVFLRRYPIARILVLLYMFMLHLWAFIVLYTYTPEIHEPGYTTQAHDTVR